MPEAEPRNRDARRILLLEGEGGTPSGLRARLAEAGYLVLAASSLEAALSLLAAEAPSLALVDLDLGRPGGGRAAARALLALRELPLVFACAGSGGPAEEEGDSVDASGYLARDSGCRLLRAVLDTAFRFHAERLRQRASGEELRGKQEQLAFAIAGAEAGVWDWRIDTGEMKVNDRWAGMLGYALEELLPIDVRTFERLVHPEDRAGSERITARYRAREISAHEIELRMLHKDGHWVWVLDRGKVSEWGEDGSPRRMSGMHFDISVIKGYEARLENLARQRENLLRELQHRVKNNLNVVSSLLNLEMGRLPEGQARRALAESSGRIRLMSAIYERLHGAEDLVSIELGAYLGDLATSLFAAYSIDGDRVSLGTSLESLTVDAARAVPLGLILNELISNALKYAFPGERRGRIEVSLERGGSSCALVVRDDGVGLPEGFDPAGGSSLGLLLVRTLAAQIRAEFRMEGGAGTRAELRFTP